MEGCRFSPIVMLALVCWLGGGTSASAEPPPRLHEAVPVKPGTMPPLAPAIIDDSLSIAGEDIKARQVDTRMTVEVRINGRGPYNFLVDSGADSSVVGMRLARDLQLPLGRPVKLNGMTGSAQVDRVLVAELSLGSSTIHDLELPELLDRDLGAEGLIGIDALVEQRLMMDFEKRVIRSEDARQPAQWVAGEIVVTARRRRGQLILTQVTAARIKVQAVIDTGSEITIGNLALRDKLIRSHRDKFVTIPVTGVTGVTSQLQLARVAELRIGSIILRDVPMAFADVPPFHVFGLMKEPSLLLGTDLLENFRRVSLDFRARKVRFQLRRCGNIGITVSTAPVDFYSRLSSGDSSEVCQR